MFHKIQNAVTTKERMTLMIWSHLSYLFLINNIHWGVHGLDLVGFRAHPQPEPNYSGWEKMDPKPTKQPFETALYAASD